MGLRIAIGADPSAYALKSAVVEFLQSSSLVDEVVDVGVNAVDDDAKNHEMVAIEVASLVANSTVDRGLAFCGNGLGVMLAANTVDGVVAVTADDLFSVRTSITTNRARVLCMGAKVVAADLACVLIGEWLTVEMPVE